MDNTPLYLFIFVLIVMFMFMFVSFRDGGLSSIYAGIASLFAFLLSKVSINGSLVSTFGWVSSENVMVFGTQSYYNSAQSYVLQFIAIVMAIVMLINIIEYIKLNILKDLDNVT